MEGLSIPRRILGEVFKDLLEAGIIRVARGPGGGYRLRESPDRISLSRLVEILEAPELNGHVRDQLTSGPDLHLGRGMDELATELRNVLDSFTVARFAAGSPPFSHHCRDSVFEESPHPAPPMDEIRFLLD